jgi:hypothetical protein
MLIAAIDQGLAEALGGEGSKAVDFFVDPRIALKDPMKYWSNLDKMFNHNSNTLRTKLISVISEHFGLPPENRSTDFSQCVNAAKAKFLSDDLVDPIQ